MLFGRGLDCEGGAEVVIERAFIEHNREIGVFAGQSETKLTMRDIVIQGTQSQESDLRFGRGLHCDEEADVVIERGVIDSNREVGVSALGPGTRLTMTDIFVGNTQSQESDLIGGRGLNCQNGAEITVERGFFDHNHEMGVAAFQQGTTLMMKDIVVQDTQSQDKSLGFGRGLSCEKGAEVVVERAVFDRNREAGVAALEPGTKLMMTDVIIQDTQSRGNNDEYGVGAAITLQASLTVNRSLFRFNRVAALLLLQSASASLSSCSFQDTISGNFTPVDEQDQPLDAPIKGVGDGLIVLSGSSVSGSDLLFSGMNRAGLLFVDSTGTLTTTTSTKNQYGMVLRGSSQPTYDETCSFEGNETPILPDGDLPVPNAPLQTPPPLN
jgi:hypothetical protein